MTTQPCEPTDEFARFSLTLRDIGDPNVRHGRPAATATQRARAVQKCLLQSFGFRCERVTHAELTEGATNGKQ